jgi:iron complex outermembrane receptor protein
VGGSDTLAASTVRLPDVVVTARKRAEGELDVPQSVTVVPESVIRDAGVERVRDAAIYVPNACFVEFTARRLSFPFVRGIGSGQGDPAVATYFDGVPLLHGSGANLPVLDVERIEFLRGPQGTLYGRNALGGLIHVFTRRPPAKFELGAEATVGSYDLREGRLVVGAPIVADRLSFRLAGLVHRRDGYTTNDFTGRDVDDRDTVFGQGQLLFTPDERNEFRLILVADRTRDGGFALSDLEGLRDRPHRIFQDFEGVTERDAGLASLTWRHAGAAVDLVSITSIQGFDVLETSDFDFSELDGVRRRTEEESRSFVQEFRVSSAADAPWSLGRDAKLAWLVGFLAFTSDSERGAANEYRPGGVGIITPVPGVDDSAGEFRDRGIGVFGQATLTFLEDFEVGAGLRYDHERKDADLTRSFTSNGAVLSSGSRDESESYDEILPRFELGYRVSEEVRAYAYAAKGFKAGGFNLDAPPGRVSYSPETSWTYEVGVKARLLDGGLRLNAALFRIDWDDMQLSQFDAAVGGYVTNAGAATSRGFEFELGARPLEGLDAFATFGLTDSEFDSYVDPYGEDVSGNDLPFAPDLTASVGAQWTGDLGDGTSCRLRAEYGHVGRFSYDAGNREGDRFGLLNLRAGVGGEHWRIDVWVRNALDAEYVPVAFQPNPGDPTVFVGESGAPRTLGLTFRLDL